MKTSDALRQLANIVLIPLGILVSSFARPGAVVPSSVAPSPEPAFAVADWTFNISLVIVFGQLLYAVYQGMAIHKTQATLRKVGWLTSANAVLGAAWTVASTHHASTVALITMFAMLIVLIGVEVRIDRQASDSKTLWFVRVPYALNLGWIAVLTMLDTAQYLQSMGYDGSPLAPHSWIAILMGVAALCGALMVLVRGNVAFTVVIIWALLGVAFNDRIDAAALANVAALCTLGLLLVIVGELFLSTPVGSWGGPQTHP